MAKAVIFSGIQPTGNIHLGNYLGAFKKCVDLQSEDKYERYYCIVDYHSLTGNRSAEERRNQIFTTAAELIALGIDPKKSILFVQSHVPAHTELAWVFNSVVPIGELERMTQFKDKAKVQNQNVNVGLFTYPVLMAADILLYHSQVVPVGEDQTQHLELTRDIVRWFNNKYGEYFSDPKMLLTEVPRVRSLLEPTKKMSKSLGEGHVIELADTPEIIEKKLKKAVTATEGGAEAPGVTNLLLLLEKFGDKNIHRQFVSTEKDGSIRYGDLKKEVASAVSSAFAEFRSRREYLLKHPKQIAEILQQGAEKAGKVAEKTMKDVRKLIGVR